LESSESDISRKYDNLEYFFLGVNFAALPKDYRPAYKENQKKAEIDT